MSYALKGKLPITFDRPTRHTQMTRIVVDNDLLNRLSHLTKPLEFCTETGVVLGTFIPSAEREAALRAEPYVTRDELRQRSKGKGYTTEEVITYLESL